MEKYAKGSKWVRCVFGCVACGCVCVFIGAEGKVKLAGKKGRKNERGERREKGGQKREKKAFLREKTPTAIFLKFYKKFLHDKIFKR